MAGDFEERAIAAAMKFAETKGWRRTTLGAIAAEAGLSLAELYRLFPSRDAILSRLMARVDAAVLAGTPVWSDRDSPRDRLFDLLMRRFDALRDYRPGLRAILHDLPWHPSTVVELGKSLNLSMSWMMAATGQDSPGCRNALQQLGLAGLYLSSLRVWLNDGTPDLARTMAALDTGLRRAEALISLGNGWCACRLPSSTAPSLDPTHGPQSVGSAPGPTIG
jgi:AcrR family transcriptional regulator